MSAFFASIWSAYWPVLIMIALALPFELWRPADRTVTLSVRLFNLIWYAILLATLVALSLLLWSHLLGWLNVQNQVIGLFPLAVPGSIWAALGQMSLVVACFDFLAYWLHRGFHAFPSAWAIHKIHHDDRELNASSSLRVHWLQYLAAQLMAVMPLIYVFGTRAVNSDSYYFIAIVSMFTHMNLRLDLGWFTPVLMGPHLHRVHHSIDPKLSGKNFSTVFPIWDILFGTYYRPSKNEYPTTGLEEAPPQKSLFAAYIQPFVDWKNLLFQAKSRH